MKNRYELGTQISLILICLAVLFYGWWSDPAGAQTTCGGEPTLWAPNNPRSEAWSPDRSYNVVVFEPASQTQWEGLRDGALDWNGYSIPNCSHVSFTATLSTAKYDPTASVPDDTIY